MSSRSLRCWYTSLLSDSFGRTPEARSSLPAESLRVGLAPYTSERMERLHQLSVGEYSVSVLLYLDAIASRLQLNTVTAECIET